MKLEDIRKELGLLKNDKDFSLEKKAESSQVDNKVAREIDEYLNDDNLEDFVDYLEKEAGAYIPSSLKDFIKKAAEAGYNEDEIIGKIRANIGGFYGD